MNAKQIQEVLANGVEAGAIHAYAKIVSTKEFKALSGLTVGNMHDITYANPDKLNIRAHAAKKARLTHKFVMFYTYNGIHKVMTAGSLEAIAGYIEMRIKSHADMLAIIGA